jgi:hypothetical protein
MNRRLFPLQLASPSLAAVTASVVPLKGWPPREETYS